MASNPKEGERAKQQSKASTHCTIASGALYVVGTPIGNLEDITLRALRTLKEVDLIACEDTRRTRKLLEHYEIRTPAVSYHEHNEAVRAKELAERLEGGARIALVSDAGTPALSDPGYRLIHLAIERSIPVVPVPGPSALVAALSACGVPGQEFFFAGFLPAKRSARRRVLRSLKDRNETLVFFEAPHRINQMLADAREALGEREAVLARELTKVHEEFVRGSISEILARLMKSPRRGEITVVIHPAESSAPAVDVPISLRQQLDELMTSQGLREREALKRLARSRGISRSEAYRRLQLEKTAEERESNDQLVSAE